MAYFLLLCDEDDVWKMLLRDLIDEGSMKKPAQNSSTQKIEVNLVLMMTTLSQSSELTSLQSIRKQSQQPLTVGLICLKRFLLDKHYSYVTGITFDENSKEFYDAYDLIVTDGTSVAKWTLSPLLNSVVQRYGIYDSCVITIDEYKLLYDEKIEGGGNGIVFVTSIRFTDHIGFRESQFGQIELLFSDELKILCERPLVSSRGYYCPMWDDDNFTSEVSLPVREDYDLDKRKTLAHIIQTEDENATIVGRVQKKSKLNHFGRLSDYQQDYPFFFNVLIVDDSVENGVPVNIWNRSALEYYNDINVGDVLLITSFKIKNCYNDKVFPLQNSQAAFTREIAVNSRKKANIFKLNNVDTNFATIDFPLTDIHDLHLLPDQSNINIIGLVVNITDYQREILISTDGVVYPEPKYAQFRYVTIIDSSALKKVNCKIYTNSRKHLVDKLEVGNLVLLTDMTLYSVCPNSKISQREFLLQTSFVSNIISEEDFEALFSVIKSDLTRNNINNLATNFENEDVFQNNKEHNGVTIPYIRINSLQLYKDLFPRHEWCFFR
jgi:hypothetical protein